MRDTNPRQSTPHIEPTALDISNEQFKEMAGIAVKLIESAAIGHKNFMPCLIIHAREVANEQGQLSDMETIIVGIDQDFNDPESKHKILRAIGRKVYTERLIPAAVFVAAEAWASTAVDPVTNEPIYGAPSMDPNRQEVLVVSGISISKEDKIGIMIPVKRDAEGVMQRDGENDEDLEVEAPLLDHFWRGYFEATAARMGKTI